MMLWCVLSGGQSGVDQAAWRAARALSFPTGGWMPAGFLTEEGPRPEFAELYGAVELPGGGYAERTRANVRDSDGTIWLGDYSTKGYRATHDAALGRGLDYPFMIVFGAHKPSNVARWVEEKGIRVLNCAGNRESVSPGIGERAERFLLAVFRRLAWSRGKSVDG